MKKISKFIYFMLAFALITCMAIFNPAITFVNAEEESWPANAITISTGKMDNTIEAGKNMFIPKPQVNHATGARTYTEVKDRSGKTYTYCWDDAKTEGTVEYFNLLEADQQTVATEADKVAFIQPKFIGEGNYVVQHKAVVGEGDAQKTYYTKAQSVQVKGVSWNWEFNKENTTKNIIPSITNADSQFALPLPTIVNSLNANANEVYTLVDRGSNIVVTKGGADVTSTVTQADTDNNKLIFAPTLDTNETSATYIITYKSKVPAFPNRTYTVKVDKNYNSEAKLEVTHNSITNVQVGAKATFPTANVTDKTHNKTNVEVNSTIIIKKGSQTVKKLDPNQFDYTFESAGTYTIYYEVEDVYGNKVTSAGYNITVNNRAPYLVSYAKDYTAQDVVDDTVVSGVDYLIPCEVGYSSFTLPAIFAKDYVTKYDGLKFSRIIELSTDSSVYFDLDSNDATHGNQVHIDNDSFNAEEVEYNKAVEFKFPGTPEEIEEKYAGRTFKVKYAAKGEGDSYTYATVYTIKIAKTETLSYNVDKNMVVNFPTINEVIDPSAELSFVSPTAKEEPKDSSLVADERVQVRTYYYYGAKNTEGVLTTIEAAYKDHIKELAADYNKDLAEGEEQYNEKYGYEFDTFIAGFKGKNLTELDSTKTNTTIKLDKEQYDALEAEEKGKVTIFAVAINDQGQFTIKAQEVNIIDTNDDDLPTIIDASVKDSTTGKTYGQNVSVTLPTVSFQDKTDKNLEVEVYCYVDTPDQTVGITIQKFIRDGVAKGDTDTLYVNEWGIESATLTTTYAGRYYIVYTATDDAGNKASYISTFDVEKTEKPYISVENGGNITKRVGEQVVFNVSLEGSGNYTDVVYDIAWSENNRPSGLGSVANSYKFDKAGTYVATISAKYKMNGTGDYITAEPSVTVTVTIKEPELKWNDDIDEILTDRTANENEKIELPIISATENGVKINAEPKVTYTDKDGKESEVEVLLDETSFNSYYFIAKNDGVYTVTYTATTEYNSDSKTMTVTCGDYFNPTVNIASNKLQGSTVSYEGTDIKLKVESFKEKEVDEVKQAGQYILKISATAGDKKVFGYEIEVTLKDVNADKQLVDLTATDYTFSLTGDKCSKDSTNNWTIKGVGNYTLSLTVKDANKNTSDAATIEFKVANKTEPKSIKDSVVGIILIVTSAVVLGGVILFFALAGKRNKAKRRKK